MLLARQRAFYVYTVSIYRQVTPNTDTSYSLLPPVVMDFSGVYTLLASGVSCMFWSTPENDTSTAIGRTKSVNIFTMDKFKFALSVSIQDTDCIVLDDGPNSTGDIGAVWMVQGNTQNHATLRISNNQMVYCKKIERLPKVN